MRVLLVKTSSMGDVIHTFPAVTDALAHVPDLTLDWMVEAPFAPLVPLHPGVRAIHEVKTRRWRKSLLSGPTRQAIGGLRARLRHASYDLVIDAQGLMKSALLARLAGVPVAGFDRSSAREPSASLAYQKRFPVPRGMHAIARTRLLLGQILSYDPDLDSIKFGLVVPPRETELSEGRDYAFLLHGTSWETKKWPAVSWVEVARALAARGLAPVTTYADDAERKVARAIAEAVPETIVVPKTGLGEIAGMLGHARLAIGVDTGFMHLACALGVPTVAIFLATRPGLTGPVSDRSIVINALDNEANATTPVSRRDRIAPGAVVEPSRVVAVADDLLKRT